MTKEQKQVLIKRVRSFEAISVPYLQRKFKITHDEAVKLYEKFKKAKLVK